MSGNSMHLILGSLCSSLAILEKLNKRELLEQEWGVVRTSKGCLVKLRQNIQSAQKAAPP